MSDDMALLLVIAHSALQFTFVVGSAQGLALVVGVLTLAEGNLHFGKALVVDKKSQGDNRFASVLDLLGEFVEFLARHEQFSVAFCLMVGVTTEAIFRYVHLFYPQFVAYKLAIGIDQRGLALADGFDLRTEELDACCITLQHLIIEGCTAVFDIYIAL